MGDAVKGYDYLVTGDYVKSGLPYNVFVFSGGLGQKDFLERGGLNKNIPHQYTAQKSSNGEVLVAPNCLQCHAQVFNDKLVMGLGNSLADFTKSEKLNTANIELLEKVLKLNAPKQYEVSADFIRERKP